MTERLSFRGSVQIAWDSTSLSTFMTCPRKYQYSMILSRAPREESVHLTFGIAYHSAMEHYHRLRALGQGHEESVEEVVGETLAKTFGWTSDHKYKNRPNLLRTVVWALEEYQDDPAETLILSNGQPAAELSFRFELPIKNPWGDPYIYSGHLDRVATYAGDLWVVDYKSTTQTLSDYWFDQFNPSVQMTGYTLGGKITLAQPVRGVIVEGAQILIDSSRFARRPTLRTEAQLSEWLHNTSHYIRLAEAYAEQEFWPMNLSACGNFGGCPFRPLCSKPPAQRETWLADYVSRPWDPLTARGDI